MLLRSPTVLRTTLAPSLRPPNNYVGALGHSMLEQGNLQSAAAPSSDIQQQSGSLSYWINILSKGQYIMDRQSWAGGVSSTTTQQMCNGPQIVAAVTCRASVILMLCETNDRGNAYTLDDGTTATLGSAGQVTIPNVKAMLNALVAAGKFVVLIIDPPRGNTAVTGPRLSGTQLLYHVAYRNWCLQQVPKLYGGQVVVVDTWADAADNVTGLEGDAKANYFRDGLHFSTRGAYFVVRNKLLPAIQGWAVPVRSVPVLSKPDTYDAATNPRGALNALRLGGLNSAAAGSAGTAQGGITFAGSRPSGFGTSTNAAAQAGTLTFTMNRNVTSPQTGETDWFEIVITGTTASNPGPQISIASGLLTAELATVLAGDKLTIFSEFQIDAGGVGLNGFWCALSRTAGALTEQFELGRADNTTLSMDTILAAQAISGFHDGEGQSITCDKTETAITATWYMALAESASPNFKVRIRNNAIRKVL